MVEIESLMSNDELEGGVVDRECRQTERQGQTDRQTDRQTGPDRQGQTDKQTDRARQTEPDRARWSCLK